MLTEKEIVTEKKSFFYLVCVFSVVVKNRIGWSSAADYIHAYVWSVHFFLYWLALLSTATATPGSFTFWPNKIQIKKLKCTIDHFFTSSNQKWYFYWKVYLFHLQHPNEQKNTCNGSNTHQKASEAHFFRRLTNERRCSFMVVFRFPAVYIEGCSIRLPWTIEKKDKRNADAVAMSLFLSLYLFPAEKQIHTAYILSWTMSHIYILPVHSFLSLSLSLPIKQQTHIWKVAALFYVWHKS